MEILICGTAAAEAWPAIFCRCEACVEARRRGGKDIRSRSGYMIGEEIRIDLGPDCVYHMQKFGLAFEKMKHLLVSHSHADHWVPQELNYRRPGFSVVPEDSVLTIYGNETVFKKTDEAIRGDWEKLRMRFVQIEEFQAVELEPGVMATPLRAAHDPRELCMNWLVEMNGTRFLQAHDTGWWSDETWEFLRDKRIDAVAMDCTNGQVDNDRGHMGCEAVARAKRKMQEIGALSDRCRFIATHFSHNGGWLHSDLEAFFGPHDIEVAWDGLSLTL